MATGSLLLRGSTAPRSDRHIHTTTRAQKLFRDSKCQTSFFCNADTCGTEKALKTAKGFSKIGIPESLQNSMMQEPGVCCDICSCSETILKIMRTPQQQRDEVLLRDHGGRAFHIRLRQGEQAATRDSGVTGVHVYKFRFVCSCCIFSAGQLLNECLQILGEKLQQCEVGLKCSISKLKPTGSEMFRASNIEYIYEDLRGSDLTHKKNSLLLGYRTGG